MSGNKYNNILNKSAQGLNSRKYLHVFLVFEKQWCILVSTQMLRPNFLGLNPVSALASCVF